tara:strand:+ start:66 stop:686 length:621 start_codon:yes stop_codon:yes gene_type:complete
MSEKPELLLFDDDEDNADLVIDALEDEGGFNVTWVSNEEEFSEKIEPDRFRVIVTDVSIRDSPDPGYKIVERIRKRNRIFRVPVIVYSSVVSVENIAKQQNELYFDYIPRGESWLGKLVKAARKAGNEPGHLVSLQYMKQRLRNEGRFQNEVDLSDMPELATLGLQQLTEEKTTAEKIISFLEDRSIDDIEWDTYEKIIVRFFKLD